MRLTCAGVGVAGLRSGQRLVLLTPPSIPPARDPPGERNGLLVARVWGRRLEVDFPFLLHRRRGRRVKVRVGHPGVVRVYRVRVDVMYSVQCRLRRRRHRLLLNVNLAVCGDVAGPPHHTNRC